jgi:hypothetical protein
MRKIFVAELLGKRHVQATRREQVRKLVAILGNSSSAPLEIDRAHTT